MQTILIIEDNHQLQQTLQHLFESDGLRVEIRDGGVSGLESFRRQLFDAVVLDLDVSGLSGLKLCRVLKAEDSSIPILVLSARAEVEDKVLLLEVDVDDYVTKPFHPKELVARVRRMMRRVLDLREF